MKSSVSKSLNTILVNMSQRTCQSIVDDLLNILKGYIKKPSFTEEKINRHTYTPLSVDGEVVYANY